MRTSISLLFSAVLPLLSPAAALAQGQSQGPGSLSIFDLVIFGVLAVLLVRLVRRLLGGRGPGRHPGQGPGQPPSTPTSGMDADPDDRQDAEEGENIEARRARARAMWQHYGGEEDEKPTPGQVAARAGGFDEQEFLEGAKLVYTRLTRAWDEGDLDDARQFLTDHMFEASERRAAQRSDAQDEGATDILLLNPSMAGFETADGEVRASVLYDVLLRPPGAQEPHQVREVWTFVKPEDDHGAMWRLDSIRQLEE